MGKAIAHVIGRTVMDPDKGFVREYYHPSGAWTRDISEARRFPFRQGKPVAELQEIIDRERPKGFPIAPFAFERVHDAQPRTE